ncbi:MAG: hypothetical protein KJT03_20025, partial [Verrucomicrobiae bacterium]|nr:hypothetical protein [Verrucomicrobiae bacterium]
NPDTRDSKWITQGQTEEGLTIKSYDPERNTVVIHSESENISRQMEMNDYAAPTALRPAPQPVRPTTTPTPMPQPQASTQAVSPTGTLVRTQQEIQRPTRRNLEALRDRRAELAEKLRKQPKPGEPAPDTQQNAR